jgi:D-aminopeptidase
MICGVPVGQHVQPPSTLERSARDGGSIMVVLATDAPLTARQLRRLCVRVAAGLARTGSTYGHGSGDFVIAFSTAHRIPHRPAALTTTRTVLADEGQAMRWLFPAVVESVEEAVLNSLFRAETVVGRDGHTRHGLPVEEAATLVRRFRPET